MSLIFDYDLCFEQTWEVEVDEFEIDKGWIAGAFFLGLFIGGIITALLIPTCMKDWEKKKKQDEEENILEAEEVASYTDEKSSIGGSRPGTGVRAGSAKNAKVAGATGFFKKKKTEDRPASKEKKGWVQAEDDNTQTATPTTDSVGMVTILTKQNSGEADSELTKQDMKDMDDLENEQKNAKDDMTLKMLKMKLRKMKGKGQISDPYLADFTQKIIDIRKGNEEIINMDRMEGEEEIRKKHGKNKALADADIDSLNIRLDAKKNQMDKDEMEHIRGELLRTSGLSEAEVDALIDQLKQELAELERKQGLEQARQSQHLAERLEKRRQLLAFRQMQEKQSRDQVKEDVQAYDEPLNNLVEDGKLMEKQKKEILSEHEKNLLNLQKQHELDAMRLQQSLAQKMQERRDQRMRKLNDKHMKEKANYLQKADKSTNSAEFATNYQHMLQQQQQDIEAAQTELDQTEIQELEKLTQNLESQKQEAIQETSEKMVQTVKEKAQLADTDVKRVLKLHNLRMDAFDHKRKAESERMKQSLQQKWQERMKKLEDNKKQDEAEREAIIEQQDLTVKRVINSNLDLSDEAKDKIMKEHERNMVSLNNQLSRSKAKQQLSLENKLAARKARLAAIQAEQAALMAEKGKATEKEIQKLQDALDQENLAFEKERRAAEADLRRRLSLETEAALAQQEKELAILIGRLEVGHARREAVLQKQDEQLKQLQAQIEKEQLENKIEDGRLSANKADQIIQQHYNQVEHVNETLQNSRERQEQMIQEKIQAKRFARERELEEEINREKKELALARRQAGAGLASQVLNQALLDQRHKKAMEELEKEMQVELEKSRDQLNAELQKSLEKELDNHKGDFLNQLAQASKVSASDLEKMAEYNGRSGRQYRPSSGTRPNFRKSRSTLGTMEEDSDEDEPRRSYTRPRSAVNSMKSDKDTHSRKKKHKFGQSKAPPSFSTSTGEQIHSAWDLDDDLL